MDGYVFRIDDNVHGWSEKLLLLLFVTWTGMWVSSNRLAGQQVGRMREWHALAWLDDLICLRGEQRQPACLQRIRDEAAAARRARQAAGPSAAVRAPGPVHACQDTQPLDRKAERIPPLLTCAKHLFLKSY